MKKTNPDIARGVTDSTRDLEMRLMNQSPHTQSSHHSLLVVALSPISVSINNFFPLPFLPLTQGTMPPASTTEKQKLLIQQEIARLQGEPSWPHRADQQAKSPATVAVRIPPRTTRTAVPRGVGSVATPAAATGGVAADAEGRTASTSATPAPTLAHQHRQLPLLRRRKVRCRLRPPPGRLQVGAGSARRAAVAT